MTKREAKELKARIEREDPAILVAGVNVYTGPRGRITSRTLPCYDRRTGDCFTVKSLEDWEARKAEAQAAESMREAYD